MQQLTGRRRRQEAKEHDRRFLVPCRRCSRFRELSSDLHIPSLSLLKPVSFLPLSWSIIRLQPRLTLSSHLYQHGSFPSVKSDRKPIPLGNSEYNHEVHDTLQCLFVISNLSHTWLVRRHLICRCSIPLTTNKPARTNCTVTYLLTGIILRELFKNYFLR